MTISPRRKRISVALGLLLLAGLGWVVWSFTARPGRMQRFCSALAVGTSVEQVEAQAAPHGYRVSSLIDGRAFVHDPISFGRFTCDVQFEADGLRSSVYSFHD